MRPLIQVKLLFGDTQIDSNFLYNRNLILWSILHNHDHFLPWISFSQVVEDEPLIFFEDKHEGSFFLILERPAHEEALRKLNRNFNIIKKFGVAFGITENNDVDFHRISTVWGNDTFGMKFEDISANFVHDVINEKVTVKLFFKDENLMLVQDTIVVIEGDNLVVVGKNNRSVSVNDRVNVLRNNFTIEIPEVLFDFENLGIAVVL